jgi:hypothetical protein
MNILITITAPLDAYRQELFNAMKGGKYTDDHLYIICSSYEKDYNVETYEAFSSLCGEITMSPFNIAPFDAERNDLEEYGNELVGYHFWRTKCEGETLYIPLGMVPTTDDFNKQLRKNFRESGKDFLGPVVGEDDEAWLNGYFVCDGSFFTNNPCIRAHRRNLMFMYRARNYTKRSVESSDPALFRTYNASEPELEPEPEPDLAKKAAKKAGKKRKKAKKAAKKKITKAAIKEAKKQLKETQASQDTPTD